MQKMGGSTGLAPSGAVWAHGSWQRIAAVLAVAMSVVSLAACGGSSSTGAQRDSITVAANSAPLSLDPAKNVNGADQQMYMSLAYEPLIFLAPDGSYKPGLATSWKSSNGLKTFDLTLRKGVKFSDGSPLTADAVVASLKHQQETNGPVVVYTRPIKSVEATGPLSVRINLVEPRTDMPLLLTQRMLIGSIISPKGLADPRLLAQRSAGAGPYMIDPSATVSGNHYTYVPNPNYYNPSAIHFKRFVIKVITDPDAALNALKSGQVAYASGSATTAPQAEAAGLVVHSALSADYGAFILDLDGEIDKPLASQKVRQALNYATDRVGITKALFGKYGRPGAGVLVPGYSGYDATVGQRYPYDLQKAKQLLAEAGYPNGFTVHMGAAPNYGNGVAMAQALASSWAKAGVKVDIHSYPTITQLIPPWAAKKLPITVGYYDGQPMSIMWDNAFAPKAVLFNPWAEDDAELSALAARAKATTGSEAAGAAAWSAVERKVVDLGWWVPIFQGSAIYFAQKDLDGVDLSPVSFAPDPVLWHWKS